MTTALNGIKAETPRIDMLEKQIQVLAWLLAEQQQRNLRLATTVASMVAQQMQPQLQQSIMARLIGGTP